MRVTRRPQSEVFLTASRGDYRHTAEGMQHREDEHPVGSVSRLSAADGAKRTHFGHRPSRRHSLRVCDVQHGDEAHSQGSVEGSQPQRA
jgi:hypothetical protein